MYYFPVISRLLIKSDAAAIPRHAPPSLSSRVSLAGFVIVIFCLGFFSQQVLRIIEQGLAVLG
jgi:NADH:ubiquinone oxidoreductase subunit 2 (subunit N)